MMSRRATALSLHAMLQTKAHLNYKFRSSKKHSVETPLQGKMQPETIFPLLDLRPKSGFCRLGSWATARLTPVNHKPARL